MAIIQTPSIASVVEDKTPQLGGSLSTNGSNINVDSGDVFYVHNLGTEGDSNYERLEVKWEDNGFGADRSVIETTAGGTGGGRTLALRAANNIIDIRSDVDYMMRIRKNFGITCNSYIQPSNSSSHSNGTTSLRWLNTYTDTITIGDGVDAVLTADAADTLALRNSTNAQAFNVYNTYTDASNYERLEVKWDTNEAVVSTATSGTGSNANLIVGGPNYAAVSNLFFNASNGTASLRYGSTEIVSWSSTTVTVARNFYPSSDSLRTNGTDTRRWLNTYTDTITIGNGVDAVLTADAADTLALRNGNNGCVQNIYKDYTDASNYERLKVGWDGSRYLIGPEAAGTGSVNHAVRIGTASNYIQSFGAGNMEFYRGGALTLRFNTSNQFDWRGNDLFSTNAGKKLGTAAKRWGGVYTDGFATNVETFTAASDTLDERNNVCLCDCTSNAITLALPVPVSGLQFHIKKIDGTANTVSIEPDDPGPELIDGAVSKVISTQYDSITVVSDGSNWFVI